jgi:uncharacterized protein YfaS (alpha-2-macroglobulin family)
VGSVQITYKSYFILFESTIVIWYESKPQPYGNNEVHREYFKDKVSIFCSYLKKGSYTFTIPLLPRYTGKFNLNPAKAELMYFPVFYGREGMKKVEIR